MQKIIISGSGEYVLGVQVGDCVCILLNNNLILSDNKEYRAQTTNAVLINRNPTLCARTYAIA